MVKNLEALVNLLCKGEKNGKEGILTMMGLIINCWNGKTFGQNASLCMLFDGIVGGSNSEPHGNM
jgi:hypothetical protein